MYIFFAILYFILFLLSLLAFKTTWRNPKHFSPKTRIGFLCFDIFVAFASIAVIIYCVSMIV
jgi:hypothetical protein